MTENKVKSHLWENYLIISLDSKWIQIIGSIPEFELKIDKDRRLCLIGPQIPREMN